MLLKTNVEKTELYTFKIDKLFEQALDTILKVKPRSKPSAKK